MSGCGLIHQSSEGIVFKKAPKQHLPETLRKLLVNEGLRRDELNVAIGSPPEDLCADQMACYRAVNSLWDRNKQIKSRNDLRSLRESIQRRLGASWDRKNLQTISQCDSKICYIKSVPIQISEQFTRIKLEIKGVPAGTAKELGKIANSALSDAQVWVITIFT